MPVYFRLRGALVRSALVRLAGLLAIAGAAPCLSQPLGLTEAMNLAQSQQPLLDSQRAGIRAAQEAKVAAEQLPDPKLKAGIVNMPVTDRMPGR
jgi:hypothetical protein